MTAEPVSPRQRWTRALLGAERYLLAVAPLLLVGSLVARAVHIVNGWGNVTIDLNVYWHLAPHVLTGDLYQVTAPNSPPEFPLPFTYPPFGAIVFLPLTWLPWAAAQWTWRVLSVICLYWLVRTALRLVAGPRWTAEHALWGRRVIVWTAALLWMQPVLHTFDFGQVNLVLAAVVLAAMTARDPRLAGMGVGLAVGVKLTPAISGLYFLATRRLSAVTWSVVAFAVSVGLGFLVAPAESRRYWFELLGDAGRVGPIGTGHNQSLRGALSRSLGYDVGATWPWLLAVGVAIVLAGLALRRAVQAGDALLGVLVVQVLGLLVSPIAWDHHWVWIAPLLIWLAYAPVPRWLRWWLLALWCPAMFVDVIGLQLEVQTSIWTFERPWYLSAVGWVYPALGLLTLAAVCVALRSGRRPRPQAQSVPEPAGSVV